MYIYVGLVMPQSLQKACWLLSKALLEALVRMLVN